MGSTGSSSAPSARSFRTSSVVITARDFGERRQTLYAAVASATVTGMPQRMSARSDASPSDAPFCSKARDPR